MAEQTGSQELPERPKEEEGEKGPSKSALKKAAKEKEKVSQISQTHPNMPTLTLFIGGKSSQTQSCRRRSPKSRRQRS
jgi:hypothetical protein